jgi:hypothetical protein
MSKFLWSSLLISPAVLGATLVVSASAMAADSQSKTETANLPGIADQQVEGQTSNAIAANPEPVVIATSLTEPASKLQLEAPAAKAQTSAASMSLSVPVALEAPSTLVKSPELVAQTATPANNNPASTLEQLNQYSSEGLGNSEAQGQVTSVSQLSDVQPTDWAFQALQSLVERYGCIAGYPDGTYRGNRAMTRYEFAAGLNSCLERVNELIAAGTANLVSREDLAALQKLQEEFAAELATLRGRVDALESRTTELEANQFSTTTKLTGEAIFALSNDFGNGLGFKVLGNNVGNRTGSSDNKAVLQQRVRLNLNTSFTGKDLLLTRLQVGNGQNFNFGATKEGLQTWQAVGNTGNTFTLDSLLYKFPATNRLNVTIAANAGTWDDIIPTVNPYFEDFDGGNGALTSFGQRNPIYRLGGGAGIGFDYAFGGRGLLNGIFGPTSFSFGYLAANAASPAESKGLFNGDYAAMGQLTFTPTKNFQFALSYNHGYFDRGNFGFDNGAANGSGTLGGFTGTGIANSLNGLTEGTTFYRPRRVTSNSYGLETSIRLNRRFVLGGWAGYTAARVIGVGDARIWNYAITLAFPDLGKEGNLGGFVIGREPYLAKLDVPSNAKGNYPNDSSWHIEGFYKFQLTDNISVTPGVVWITNPNQNNKNDDIIIGTLRTTFTF